MSDKVYIGPNKVGSFEKKGEYEPVSRVTMWWGEGDDEYFTAGDDTGREMRLNNPYATQTMVDYAAKALKGHIYRPFEARDVIWDPAIELGDGINIGGIYSMLGHVDMKFGREIIANISCPGGNATDCELPFETQEERELKRRVKLGQKYQGVSIDRRNGLTIVETDGETEGAKVILNSKELAFYDGAGQEQLYFDPAEGCYKFRGAMNVNDKFIVDKLGNVTINGSLTMTGSSNWLLTRYSTDKNAPVPNGWTEAWDDKWNNTSTQVWAIYSYDGGAKWTMPMLAQGKDGVQGPTGPSGSDANVPAWVKAYTASAEFNTKVTDEWVVTMNLLSAKIFGGDYYSQDGNGHFKVEDNGRFANFRLFDKDFMSGEFPVIALGTDNVGTKSIASMLMYGTEILGVSKGDMVTRPKGNWDFSDANVSGVTARFA